MGGKKGEKERRGEGENNIPCCVENCVCFRVSQPNLLCLLYRAKYLIQSLLMWSGAKYPIQSLLIRRVVRAS
jgi:hypothetical protein